MEGLGYDDREISGLDTDTVVQRAAQFCQVKDQEKSEHQEGFTTGNGDRRLEVGHHLLFKGSIFTHKQEG